jgi:hypothetical protein
MRERILGNKILELLKTEKTPLTAWQISKRLNVKDGNVYSAIANLTFYEPLAENETGGIYLMANEE